MDGKHPRQLRPVDHPVRHQADDDDYKAAAKDVDSVDYKQFMPKLKPEHTLLMRIVKLMVCVVVIGGLGYGAYYVGSHYNEKSTKSHKEAKTTVATTVTPPTRTYTSSNQNLTFTYPTGWKVGETVTVLTATSPVTELTGYNRKSVDGRIIFRIRAQNVALPEFDAGNALALLPSQIVTYTSPTSDQEGTTYISFLNYANSKGSGIDGIYVTGNTGYQTGQYATETEVEAVDPIVSFTFEKCTNTSCSATMPLTVATSSWNEKSFYGPLLTMLESLSIS